MNLGVIGFGFLIGAILGSLVKALADRSVDNKTFFGRSKCDKCKKSLSPLDLIPIFSYLFSRGKCRHCGAKLSVEYLLVEVLMGLLISFLFFQEFKTVNLDQLFTFSFTNILLWLDLIFKTFIISVLVIVLLTDLKTGLIPDRITYPAIVIGFVYLIVITILKIGLLYLSLSSSEIGKYLLPPHSDYFFRHSLLTAQPLVNSLVAALILAVFFMSIIILTRGRGMGGGDFKLGIFLGLVFGFPVALVVLMIAFLSGSIVGILLMIFGKKRFGQTIPFGPFLTLGGIISLFFGEQLLNWYLNYQLF